VDSFQFIKENYHTVNKQISASVDIDHLEEAQTSVQNTLPLVLQPQGAIEYQIEEDSRAAVHDQVIQVDPLPLCVQPSKVFEEEEKQPAQISQGPDELASNKLQISVQVLYDSCANRGYDEVKRCSSPLIGRVPQYQNVDDISIPRHDSDPKLLYSSLIQFGNNVICCRTLLYSFLFQQRRSAVSWSSQRLTKPYQISRSQFFSPASTSNKARSCL